MIKSAYFLPLQNFF